MWEENRWMHSLGKILTIGERPRTMYLSKRKIRYHLRFLKASTWIHIL